MRTQRLRRRVRASVGRLMRQRPVGLDTADEPDRVPSMPPRRTTRVAAILDEFSWGCFEPEAELVDLHPDRWREQLDAWSPAFLLVESAWAGNRGRWRYAVAHYDRSENVRLAELLGHARSTGLPTVFWNKEDPPNFDQFAPAARDFEHVLTTAAECVPLYEAFGTARTVGVLPFAAQTRLHHPAGDPTAAGRVCFAGAWRASKYPARARSLAMILTPALEAGVLDIFDRHADGKDGEPFPDRFQPAVRGALSYSDTIEAYRRYGAFLNVNTTESSTTMLSRRVFEILASGTPVISTPSEAITEIFGAHVVTVSNSDDVRDALAEMLGDERSRRRRGHRSYRFIHRHHSYRHRWDEILAVLGLPDAPSDPSVAVMSVVDRLDEAGAIVETADQQSRRPDRLLLVARAGRSCDEISRMYAQRHDIDVVVCPTEATAAACLSLARSRIGDSLVAIWSPADLYGPEMLADQVTAFDFADAAIVGKSAHASYDPVSDVVRHVEGRRFELSVALAPGALLIDATRVRDVDFRDADAGVLATFVDDAQRAGKRLYAADEYNYVANGRVLPGSRSAAAATIESDVLV